MHIVTIRPIRTAADLQATKARLAGLIGRPNTVEHDDEIEVLTTLVEQFEEKYSHIDAPTPVMAIKFRMEEKGLTPRQLEPFIGSRARVSEVLSGKRQLSIDMIRSLHEGLGIPYESLISDRPKGSDVKNISAPAIERLNSLGFNLGPHEIPSFISSSLSNSVAPALLRKTRTQRAASKTDQGALLLWQAAVLQKSETAVPKGAFEPSEFGAEDLRRIARMSTKVDGPRRAIRTLTEKGISVVIMPPLPGTFLDGAAMASQAGNPVVGLTLRYDRIDSFWYTLLHELAHVALHFNSLVAARVVFVDDMEIRSDDDREREADALARDSLIPPDILSQVTWGPATTYDDLVALAARTRVHLSVVAGRWQRDHQNYKKFSRLIDRNSIRSMLLGAGTTT
jgi:HTH-type transcriptional regulator/antitoxin HigA